MGTLYVRAGEEPTKKCDECGTVWRDSWLEDKYMYACPYCFTEWTEDTKIRLKKVPNKTTTYKHKKLADLKLELAEVDHKIWELEGGTPLDCGATPFRWNPDKINSKHYDDLQNLAFMHSKRTYLISKITEAENKLGQK